MSCARQTALAGPLFSGGARRAVRPPLMLLVLLAFALRAIIPVGFMPAGDGTLSLMICPGGFPPALLPEKQIVQDGMGMPMPQPHHHQGQGVMDDGYCIFTTGFSSAPPPPLVAAFGLLIAILGIARTRVLAPAGIRLVYVPQAR